MKTYPVIRAYPHPGRPGRVLLCCPEGPVPPMHMQKPHRSK